MSCLLRVYGSFVTAVQDLINPPSRPYNEVQERIDLLVKEMDDLQTTRYYVFGRCLGLLIGTVKDDETELSDRVDFLMQERVMEAIRSQECPSLTHRKIRS